MKAIELTLIPRSSDPLLLLGELINLSNVLLLELPLEGFSSPECGVLSFSSLTEPLVPG